MLKIKKPSRFVIVYILIFTLILLGLGYWVKYYRWDTFRNKKYNFEVQYPKNWVSNNGEVFLIIGVRGKSEQEGEFITIRVLDVYKGLEFSDIDIYTGINKDCKKIVFAGRNARDCLWEDIGTRHIIVFTNSEGIPIEINDVAYNDDSKKIISTFRFLK